MGYSLIIPVLIRRLRGQLGPTHDPTPAQGGRPLARPDLLSEVRLAHLPQPGDQRLVDRLVIRKQAFQRQHALTIGVNRLGILPVSRQRVGLQN